MIDAVASDYQDTIAFVAVAGRSDFDSSAAKASELISANVPWGFDESIWEMYDVLGQPASVMITGDDIIVDSWFGAVGEEEIRAKFVYLLSVAG
mgnify:CR=1 FL=1